MGIQERKDREKEQRSEEILNAAENIFFEKGLNAATMDEIAEKAELGKSTLYLYYKSKEDLYLAVMMRGGAILHSMFREAVSTGEPTLKLIKNLGDAYYEYFKQHRNYFRMYYFFENTELHTQVSEEMSAQCADHDRKIWKLVFDVIQRAKDEGMLEASLDPVQAGVILWSNENGLMRQMDRADNYWTSVMHVDLDATIRKANAYVLEGMMTEKAKKQFPELLIEN